MNWIQGLLITSIIALLVYLLRSRRSAQSKAWVKVGYLVFVLAGVYAVLRPNDTTVVAHWLGVDRGHRPDVVRADHRVQLHHVEHLSPIQRLGAALRATGPRRRAGGRASARMISPRRHPSATREK